MKIAMAPLQGFTEAPLRNAFSDSFGGVAEYYTPFVRLEKGKFRNKDLKDVDPANNTVTGLVPQIIASEESEAVQLVGKLVDLGYSEIDLNMGCPFPLLVRKGKGAGILSDPERVASVLKVIGRFPQVRFSVKLRLGWDSPEQLFALADLLNTSRLRQITLHPRLGIQQYKGSCSLDLFARFYEICQKPLVYNGDIMKVSEMKELTSSFPRLEGIMIGRGLLARPWLAAEYAEDKAWTAEQKRTAFRNFHDRLLQEYVRRIEGGEHQLLSKMQSLWEYLLAGEDRKKLKKVRKASDLNSYRRAVDDLISVIV